ncbi:hypothetical protein EVAR_68316_1 [Eumeta japonica]|uniref:Uncharacterized protein n=1 Tax=Eumeta variegata TaxID=151549 RepID=A0A4C2A8D8_EUMVA|nr:hypothetical protein EVAR_68316_1 [Eumeta japonica]
MIVTIRVKVHAAVRYRNPSTGDNDAVRFNRYTMSAPCVRLILFLITAQLLWATSGEAKSLIDSIFRNPYERVKEHIRDKATEKPAFDRNDPNYKQDERMIEARYNVPDRPCRAGTRRDITTMVCRPLWN